MKRLVLLTGLLVLGCSSERERSTGTSDASAHPDATQGQDASTQDGGGLDAMPMDGGGSDPIISGTITRSATIENYNPSGPAPTDFDGTLRIGIFDGPDGAIATLIDGVELMNMDFSSPQASQDYEMLAPNHVATATYYLHVMLDTDTSGQVGSNDLVADQSPTFQLPTATSLSFDVEITNMVP